MRRFAWLAALSLAGAVIALLAVFYARQPEPAAAGTDAPPAPFASFVAGSGLTEVGRGNIAVGTSVAGVVRQVDVKVGDTVAIGQPLFEIEGRDLAAQLPVVRAQFAQAQAALDKPRHRLEFLRKLRGADRAAISIETLSAARDDERAAATAVEAARAREAQVRTDLERLVVRAPAAGRVLQVNVRAGQFAEGGGAAAPLMLVGDDSRLYLRVDVDENDAWRVRAGARAVAAVRGNSRLRIPLRFEYIEPFVTPKATLTGQATERTDLRVLQVVYSFARGSLPVYLGQQMDAFIETPPDSARPVATPR
jgi:multidrug efflux pump subunit AcrA (membrane-fusion protein)